MKHGQTIMDPAVKQAARMAHAAKIIKATPRNSPCPCGSGKKVKKCCLTLVPALKKKAKRDYMAAVATTKDTHQELNPLDPGAEEKARTHLTDKIKEGYVDMLTQIKERVNHGAQEPADSPFNQYPTNHP